MSEAFQYIDILILAIIAGIVLLRLRSVLGRRTGHEKTDKTSYNYETPQQSSEEKVVTIEPKVSSGSREDGWFDKDDFSELKKGVDENDMEKIIDLATDYGIDINEDIDSVDFYENRIEELKAKIEHFSKTVVMQWWNMNDADRKKYESTFIKVLRDD